MKKLFLLTVIGAVLTATVFGQALDFPSWLKEGMTLNEIRNELKGVSVVNDWGDYYKYTQNGITHSFMIPKGWGLIQYSIEAKNIDVNKLISDLSKKYNLPQPEYRKEYSYYRWDLKEISKKNKMPLYTERHIGAIEISQGKDTLISLCVSFTYFYEWEEEIQEYLNEMFELYGF